MQEVVAGATPAIELRGLTKRFKELTAVDALSFSVPVGSIFGFLGPNGAGKTTTIGMLLGLTRPDAGSALIFGHDVLRDLPAALARTGALIERPAFYPYLSGRRNLQLVARLAGITDQGAVERALERVGLTERADATFNGYSQGMRQRLGLAAALITEPDLVVLDEPTNGLDPAGQREIQAMLREIAAAGRTVFVSSHLLYEVQEVCTHVAIIDRGRLIQAGPLDEIVSGGARVLVRVDRPDEARGLLLGLPDVRDVTVRDGWLYVDAPVEATAVLNRALVTAGFAVSELRREEGRLEERFLALTSHTPAAEGA